jgi:hypothetical protein
LALVQQRQPSCEAGKQAHFVLLPLATVRLFFST